MRMFTIRLALILWCTAALCLSGCLTSKPSGEQPSAQAFVLPEIAVDPWGDNTCGAGALSTVLRHYGDSVTEEDLVPLLPTGRNGGVVSIDLLLAARQRGFEASLIRGSEERIRESIEAGNPAIVMIQVADLPGASRDLFHYLVIDGHDPGGETFRAQFGDGKARWISLGKFTRQWAATDFATLLVAPQQDGKRADRRIALGRAVLLEEQGHRQEALDLYRAILDANPRHALAWLNLGNVQMKMGSLEDAETSYREALHLAPGDRDVMNNLAWLLVQQNRNLEEAELLARRAALEMGADAFLYFDTLGEVLRVRGNCEDAVDQFETALFSVPADGRIHRSPILFNLSRAQIDCNRPDEAKRTLEQALESDPDEALRSEIESVIAELTSH